MTKIAIAAFALLVLALIVTCGEEAGEAVKIVAVIESELGSDLPEAVVRDRLTAMKAFRVYRVERDKFDHDYRASAFKHYPPGARWALCGMIPKNREDPSEGGIFVDFVIMFDSSDRSIAAKAGALVDK